MNLLFAILNGALAGLNGYLAIGNFMDGDIGLGVFGAVAALWCLVGMVVQLVKVEFN